MAREWNAESWIGFWTENKDKTGTADKILNGQWIRQRRYRDAKYPDFEN